MKQLLECIPNISEGRNLKVIIHLQDTISKIGDVKLLHVDRGESANRTVFTFAGDPHSVVEAAFSFIKEAGKLIDMRKHKGIHPRIGAVDVCPLVPIKNISMDETVKLSRNLSEKVGYELDVPVYCYEEAAFTTYKKNLENIRKGEYEGLKEKMMDPLWKPDFGPANFNDKFGAVVIGARNILLAYNVNLNTTDRSVAKEIAAQIRGSGKLVKNGSNHIKQTFDATLKNVKAIGWFMDNYGFTQVSTNITNVNETPVYLVYETIKKLAEKLKVEVTGSELIGLVPLDVLLKAGRFYIKTKSESNVNKLLNTAINSLGLNSISDFCKEERILEYRLKAL